MASSVRIQRRTFLERVALSAAFLTAPGAFAEALTLTPRQTKGPFYPDHLPLDRDNDLIILGDSTTPAVGEISHLSGRVLDPKGNPVNKAVVEIWQVDNNGVYIHSGSPGQERLDRHFQGFGRFETGSTGEYRFRTIKPVPYAPGSFQRTPHIHVAVAVPGHETFTTQCYVKGHPMNARDGILQSIPEGASRDAVLVDFTPIPESATGELAAQFNIVLGITPRDNSR
ncbi:MAG: hypothetical protein AMXMBFR82_52440 [Candidatus Hydrogenedentota bacterium]